LDFGPNENTSSRVFRVTDVIGSIVIALTEKARWNGEQLHREHCAQLKNTPKETWRKRQSLNAKGDACNNCDLRFSRWRSKARRVRNDASAFRKAEELDSRMKWRKRRQDTSEREETRLRASCFLTNRWWKIQRNVGNCDTINSFSLASCIYENGSNA